VTPTHAATPPDPPAARTGRVNLPGVLGTTSAGVALFSFEAATHTGKGGELIPLALTLVAGCLAIVLGVAGWVWGRRRRREQLSAVLAVGFGIGGLSLLVLVWPALARERMGRQPCASALRQIGQALLMYSTDHGGRIPDRLQDLTAGPDALPANALLCPNGSDRPGQFSFDYLGAGRRYDDFSANDIVAFEPPHNHHSDGGYALFGDGHVEFVYPASELREDVERVKKKLTTRPAAAVPTTTTGAGGNR
jgi:hypothetical protein